MPNCLMWFFLLCFSVSAGQPVWFSARNLQAGENELIGYGTGSTEEDAVSRAKKEIAVSIETRIYSKNKIETNVNNKEVDERANFFIQSETDVVLNDVAVLKKEKMGKFWYVGVKSDTRPVEKKLAAGLSGYECSNERQNSYLKLTPLFKSVNEEVKCDFDIKLLRNNKLWYLSYKNMNICMNNDAFQKLLVSYTTPEVSIASSKTLLHEGDAFTLEVHSKLSGYVTIVNACQDGEVFILDANRTVTIDSAYSFPDNTSTNMLVAGLIAPWESTYDLYIAIATKTPLSIGRLQFAGAQVEKKEWNYKFDELLTVLNDHKFSAVLVRTEPR